MGTVITLDEELIVRRAHVAAMHAANARYDAAVKRERETFAAMLEASKQGRFQEFAEREHEYKQAYAEAIAALFGLGDAIGPQWRERLAKFDQWQCGCEQH